MSSADTAVLDREPEAPAPTCPGCPRPLEFVDCPHGCGLRYFAAGQRLTAEQFWRYGPWRMSVHTAGHQPGKRCARPLYDAPVSFTIPTTDTTTTDTEEQNNGMGPQSNRRSSRRAGRGRGTGASRQ